MNVSSLGSSAANYYQTDPNYDKPSNNSNIDKQLEQQMVQHGESPNSVAQSGKTRNDQLLQFLK